MSENFDTYPQPAVTPLTGNPDQIRAQWLAEEEARLNQRAYGGPAAPNGAPTSSPVSDYFSAAQSPVVPEAYWPTPTVSTRPRPTTIVWGFIVAAIGVMALITSRGLRVDTGRAFIWVLAAGGIGLIGASIFNAARRRHRT